MLRSRTVFAIYYKYIMNDLFILHLQNFLPKCIWRREVFPKAKSTAIFHGVFTWYFPLAVVAITETLVLFHGATDEDDTYTTSWMIMPGTNGIRFERIKLFLLAKKSFDSKFTFGYFSFSVLQEGLEDEALLATTEDTTTIC